MFFPLSLDPETIENQIIYFDPKKLVGLFAMATPFRRRGYHGAYLVGIGELRNSRFRGTGKTQVKPQQQFRGRSEMIPKSSIMFRFLLFLV